MKADLAVWLTTNKGTTWFIRHVASRLDPLVFKATNGRFFSMGKASMPMVTLTTRGRKTGKPRAIHLAAVERDGITHVVASAMGQARHPAWSHNIEAHPEVAVQADRDRYVARAERLSEAEKAAIWPQVKAEIPQMNVYEKRTDRDIRVYRLRRAVSPD